MNTRPRGAVPADLPHPAPNARAASLAAGQQSPAAEFGDSQDVMTGRPRGPTQGATPRGSASALARIAVASGRVARDPGPVSAVNHRKNERSAGRRVADA